MKRLASAAAALLFVVGACHHKKPEASKGPTHAAATLDPVYATYRASLANLMADETAALAAANAHMGQGFTDDATLLAALKDTTLPRYTNFVEGLQKITPPDDELKALHGRLIKTAEDELALLERLEKGVEAENGTAILLFNSDQRKVRGDMDALVSDFDAIAVKHGAEPREKVSGLP